MIIGVIVKLTSVLIILCITMILNILEDGFNLSLGIMPVLWVSLGKVTGKSLACFDRRNQG